MYKLFKVILLILVLSLTACDKEPVIITPDNDTTSPLIILNAISIEKKYNESINLDDYIDMKDDVDGIVTSNYIESDIDSFDLSVVGEYSINFTIYDKAGNSSSDSIIVSVIDTDAPTIVINPIELEQGSLPIDVLPFISASDPYDKALIVSESSIDFTDIDFNTPGEYDATITACDSSLNCTEESFIVTIFQSEFIRIGPEDDIDDYKIYYILESNIPGYYDYHISAKAIQGIVNRNQPNLMIIDQNNPYYTYTDTTWQNYLEDEGYEMIELQSYLELLVTFESYFSDIIGIDDDYKSYNNWVSADADFGAMIASVTTYMPVPENYIITAEQYMSIELIDSFVLNDVTLSGLITDNFDYYEVNNSREIYAFLFNNFKELFNSQRFMGLTSEAMDLAVFDQMMFFDLKPTYNDDDEELYRIICEYFDAENDYFQLYGWVDQEGSGLDYIGRYGGMIDVVGTQNLSLYKSIKIDYDFKQKSEFLLDSYDASKKYVTFIASEGDTFKAPTTFQQGSWLDDNRGSVPINWGLLGLTVEEFPIIAKYFYETMTPNDYFFSGGSSSIGYVDIDTQMPDGAVTAIAEKNQEILILSDQSYVDTYNDLFMFGDQFNPTFTGDYLIASGYKGAYGINPWEPTGPIYMSDMLFYNRRNVFYPRRGNSSYVTQMNLTKIDNFTYEQNHNSDYWYIQTDLSRSGSYKVQIDFFTQSNGDGYYILIDGGQISLHKHIGNEDIIITERALSIIGEKELIITVDKSSSLLSQTEIIVYLDQSRIINEKDSSFSSGGFKLYSEEDFNQTFKNLKGLHKSQSEEIYDKILNDPNQFIVGYYGVVFDHDFTLSQYHTEPGPGEVISLSPTDFLRIQLLLEENYPNEYIIVNMDEFYTYLEESESN